MPASKKKLSEKHKIFMVQRLAMYDSPREAAEALKEEFGIEISVQAAEHYDPHRHSGKSLAKRFVELFEESRKRFIDDINEIPSANRAGRVRRLERMALDAERKKNYVLAASLYEQIAKETGNVFTNRRELTGKKGGAIKFQDVSSMDKDQVDDELRRLGVDPDVHKAPETVQ